jgi:uncharacterized protein (DUF1501 family)
MRTLWHDDLSRRTLLKLGVSSAVLMTLPFPGRRAAWADPAHPHFLVTFVGDGGWDVTQVLDVHDPADMTDGIDVDVPQAISNLPPSQIATAGGITYISNPTTRPATDTFFGNWGSRAAIVNGIGTRSTSHDQSRQLVLTGFLDPTRADFAVMAANQNGADLPLPHLLLSGPSFAGPFAGLSGRVGEQLETALAFDRVPDPMNSDGTVRSVSAAGEQLVQQTLASQAQLDDGGWLHGRMQDFQDANVRGDRLVQLANSLPNDDGDAVQLATSLGAAFRSGMSTSVTVSNVGGFDTHTDNTQQNDSWQRLFTFLDAFVGALATQPGLVAPSLLDETTIVYCSEFARTPELNGDNGKDHHPWTSMLLVGKRVRGGVTVGLTDSQQVGVKIDFASGLPSDTGQVIDVTNMIAGILTLVGANSGDYLPGVPAFTGMIGA